MNSLLHSCNDFHWSFRFLGLGLLGLGFLSQVGVKKLERFCFLKKEIRKMFEMGVFFVARNFLVPFSQNNNLRAPSCDFFLHADLMYLLPSKTQGSTKTKLRHFVRDSADLIRYFLSCHSTKRRG